MIAARHVADQHEHRGQGRGHVPGEHRSGRTGVLGAGRPGQGIKVQVRKTQGGTTTKLANPAGTAPAYLKVTWSGTTFTAYTSADGVTWTLIPGSTASLTLGSSLLAGLAVTSHNSGALGTVTMDGVAVG